ncbi:hypothetical protein ACHAW6_003459 [Cyclotella cf. meneghiniana]
METGLRSCQEEFSLSTSSEGIIATEPEEIQNGESPALIASDSMLESKEMAIEDEDLQLIGFYVTNEERQLLTTSRDTEHSGIDISRDDLTTPATRTHPAAEGTLPPCLRAVYTRTTRIADLRRSDNLAVNYGPILYPDESPLQIPQSDDKVHQMPKNTNGFHLQADTLGSSPALGLEIPCPYDDECSPSLFIQSTYVDEPKSNKIGPEMTPPSGLPNTEVTQMQPDCLQSRHEIEVFSTPQDSSTHMSTEIGQFQPDVIVPEAFLVDPNVTWHDGVPSAEVIDIPSAQIVVPDKYSLIISGRKIHVGFLILISALIIVVMSGLSWNAAVDSDNSNPVATPTIKNESTHSISNQTSKPGHESALVPIITTENAHSQPNQASRPSPTSLETTSARDEIIQEEFENNILRRNLTFTDLPDYDCRKLALNWILHDDPMQLNVSDSNLHQRYILALLAYQSGPGFTSTVKWLQLEPQSNLNECEWSGVACINGRIQSLFLDDTNLSGTLPPEISGLKFLEALVMSANSISGTLPPEIGDLTRLGSMSFSSNFFDGTFPTEIGNLKELTHLDFRSNLMHGTFPPIWNSEGLSYLDISHNQFSGTISPRIQHLMQLTQFYIEYNQFFGSLPSSMRQLKKLNDFRLSENQFSGTFPILWDSKELSYLYMNGNQFSGTVPAKIEGLQYLAHFHIEFNSFQGTLPSAIGNLERLVDLVMSNNQFTGTLPMLGNLTRLTWLDISDNYFNGTLPLEIGNLKELTNLYIQNNQFVGTLPSAIGNLIALDTLWLYNNKFNGTLPSELGNLKELRDIWLNNNQFSGTFPSEMEDNLDLTCICFYANFFEGTLPPENCC